MEKTAMFDVLPPWPLFGAFLAAAFLLAVTPGPGVIYIVARSVTQGRAAGLASVLGIALGNLGNAWGAALGLGALLTVSTTAFLIVKYAGAAYLMYLGVQMLRAPSRPSTVAPVVARNSKIFRDGFVVALLNPKTALFFAALLPQFMSVDVAPILQSMALGTSFVAIALGTDTAYALAASALAPLMLRTQRVRSTSRYLGGGAFIGLGVFAALAGSRVSR